MMQSFKVLAILVSFLCQVKPKAVNKESSFTLGQDYRAPVQSNQQKFPSNYERYQKIKTFQPMIDGKPIYIPKTYPERKGLEVAEVEREPSLEGTKYELDDSKSSETLLNYYSQDSSFDNDEVFVIDQRKISKTSNSKRKKSPNIENVCDETVLKAMSSDDEYTQDCNSYKNASEKSKATIIDGEQQKHLKNKKTEMTVKDGRILSDITKNEESLKSLKNISPVIEMASLDLKSSKDKPLNIDQDNDLELPTDMLDDEHHTLQEEVRNMFTPSFKSFVFNPVAKNQVKFQECKTAKNESGNCRYVQHCFLPSILSSVEQFMNNVCIIESRFIGVCCPEFPVSKVTVNWKNQLENIGGSNDPVKTPKECGIGTNTRIVGGTDATIKAWPWMVALLNNRKKFFCGGALINDRYVLTAAHCTFGTRSDQIIARLGEFDFSSDEGVHEDYMVEEIKRHGQYTSLTLRNDIALLKLHKPVVFNEFVRTICLPDPQKNYTDEMATLTGWGHIQGGISAFTSDKLQEASFPVVTNEECSKTHGIAVPLSLICTAAPSKNKGACNGDSGGPLMLLDDEDRWKVIGIVSWGRRGCSTKYPSVFTRVTFYLDWIKEHAV